MSCTYGVPYSGKILQALNLAKWRKKIVFWYWRNLTLVIWNCTCDVIIFTLWRNRSAFSAWRTLACQNWEWRLFRPTAAFKVPCFRGTQPQGKNWTACEKGETLRILMLWLRYVEALLLAMSPRDMSAACVLFLRGRGTIRHDQLRIVLFNTRVQS